MINTRYDELYIRTIFRANIVGISIPTISFGITKRVNTEIHFRLASKLHLIEIYYQLRRAAPLSISARKNSHGAIREWRVMHAYEWRSYNCTHVVLSKGRRDWPVAGFPFVRDADRLCRFLLYRFRLVEQRQLVKLLDICNSPKKKEKTYYHLPRSSRRSEVKSPRTVWPPSSSLSQTAGDFISFLSGFPACKRHDKLTRNSIQSVRSHRMHRANVRVI